MAWLPDRFHELRSRTLGPLPPRGAKPVPVKPGNGTPNPPSQPASGRPAEQCAGRRGRDHHTSSHKSVTSDAHLE
jgi:hypothetical protein